MGSCRISTRSASVACSNQRLQGVENLDAVTHGMSLDYFVLFSSAVTLMGNPGQANYVAANAYMEGVARRRRQEGVPHSQSAGGRSPMSV